MTITLQQLEKMQMGETVNMAGSYIDYSVVKTTQKNGKAVWVINQTWTCRTAKSTLGWITWNHNLNAKLSKGAK
jgi:hypothetical protein